MGGMATRFQRNLRMLLALLTLSCAGAFVTVDPVSAAPSSYAAPLALPRPHASGDAQGSTSHGLRLRRTVAACVGRSAALPPSAADVATREHVAPTLLRAPELYLRHCALLR
jgi:hypothetical protein